MYEIFSVPINDQIFNFRKKPSFFIFPASKIVNIQNLTLFLDLLFTKSFIYLDFSPFQTNYDKKFVVVRFQLLVVRFGRFEPAFQPPQHFDQQLCPEIYKIFEIVIEIIRITNRRNIKKKFFNRKKKLFFPFSC